MPTMSAWMTYLPKGFETASIRSTDSMVFAIAAGRGSAMIGEKSFSFGSKDIHAVPAWTWRSFKAVEDTFIFFFSDRVAQEKLGLFREHRS